MLQTSTFYAEYFVIISCAVILFFVVFFYLFIIQLYRRRTIHQKEMFDLKTKYEQTLLQSQLEIQEQTFRNISQEIHDNIGQVLSLAKLNLNTIPQNYSTEKIALTEELLGKAINDLRDLSRSLHSEKITDIGLTDAVKHELSLIEKASRIKTKLSTENNDLLLSKEKTIITFRMIQEILHNILKHAKATEIFVELSLSKNHNSVTIKDNGLGFDINLLKKNETGIGLKSIKQRCELINATCHIDSAPGNGTSVKIIIYNTAKEIL